MSISKVMNEAAYELDVFEVRKLAEVTYAYDEDDLDKNRLFLLKKRTNHIVAKNVRAKSEYKNIFKALADDKFRKDFDKVIGEIGVQTAVLAAYWFCELYKEFAHSAKLPDENAPKAGWL